MKFLLLFVSSISVTLASNCEHTTDSSPTPTDSTSPTPTTVWPQGSYSLPKPTDGCPGAEWKEGGFYQDTEDNYNGNKWNVTNMAGFLKKDGFKRSFCTKYESRVESSAPWPAGSYCLLKKNECPAGFEEGSILWDDEDKHSMNNGGSQDPSSLPDGEFGWNTMLKYCCRDDGNATTEIALPTDASFYLLMRSQVCQEVAGMSVEMETIFWDDEDNRNVNSVQGETPFNLGDQTNHALAYCYYTPLKEGY